MMARKLKEVGGEARVGVELLVLVGILLLVQPSLPHQVRSTCPCSTPPSSDTSLLSSKEEFVEVTTTKYHQLNCCPSHLLSATTHNSDNVNITWWHKGVQFPWERDVSTFRLGYCGRESLESVSLLLVDEGQFVCSIAEVSTGRVLLNKTFSLCVNRNDPLAGPPIKSDITGDAWALLGDEATFRCSAFVGRRDCGGGGQGDSDRTPRMMMMMRANSEMVSWSKETQQPGVWEDVGAATHLSNVNITVVREEEGTVRSVLAVSRVQRAHYGRYRCTITNSHGSVHLIHTLSHGVAPSERAALSYRSAVLVMVAAAVSFTITTIMWHRCRLAFAFYFRGRVAKGAAKTEDGHVDILVVHGDSATHWVGSVLLPVLEHTYHYTCFLPHRDMLAGDLILEEVATRVWRCNRVLVVVTPCLLQCSWAAWALHHALQASLTASTRLIALKLQDIKATDHTSSSSSLFDPYDIVKSLKPVRSLRVPASCSLQTLVMKEDETPAAAHDTSSTHEGGEAGSNTDTLVGGSKEDRVKLTDQLANSNNNNEKKDNRDISSHKNREGKEHWRKLERHHHQERKSRLEVPGSLSSSSKIRSRSRSRSKSPMECTWRLIEEEQLEEDNCNNFTIGSLKSNRAKKTDLKIPTTAYTVQQPKKAAAAVVAVDKARRAHVLKLSLPPPQSSQPPSRSPGSQRLSNMVTGCGGGGGGGGQRVCPESLMKPDKITTTTITTKNIKKNKSKVYEDDLGSPSSITPFIFTPTTAAASQPSGWHTRSVCESLSLVFTSDRELVFWHTLLYRLGPPSATPLHV